MKKFITLLTVFAAIGAFAFDWNNSDKQYQTTVNNLIANKANNFVEAPIVAAEALLKDLEDSGIKEQGDLWKLRYLRVYANVNFQRNKDMSFEDSVKKFDAKAKEIGLSDSIELSRKLGSMLVPDNSKQFPDVYNYLKSLEDTSWRKNFIDGGYYADKTGNYEDAYDLYIESGFFYDRAMNIAINNLKDYDKAIEAAKNICVRKLNQSEIEMAVENIINKLYRKSKNKTEIIAILEDINFTYSQYLSKEGNYTNAVTRVRQTLDAYYSVKR